MLDSMHTANNSTPFPTTNREFLAGIFGPRLWSRAHVCAIPGDPRDPAMPKFYWRGGPAHPEIAACTLDTNNYYCVGVFKGSRQLVNFEALVVLGIDDIGPKVDRARVLDLMGTPSYRIETSPGNEQWGYVIDPPFTHGDGAAALQHKVRVLLTGASVRDPGMEGLNRYLRLPYGVNRKADYGPKGHRTRLLAWGE